MKKKLRKEYLQLRRGYKKENLDKKNKAVKENLESLEEVIKSKNILFYISFENEVETHDLIKDALKQNKKVIVPYIEKKEIYLSDLKDFNELEKGKFGILEPKKKFIRKADIHKVDLIIVPGVAFDKKGHRIGFGAAYYDKLLKKSKAIKIGLAYEFQIVDEIPKEAHDVAVDIIISEKQILRFKK
ncbi:5-formyltetrahydrofolate cyclo-ligase [Candidatus Woesearchaeota archaeon]|nr:5-formyltetrahydrofolate cyclo-ligase [Candidatus Woesearchaeota archaeon]